MAPELAQVLREWKESQRPMKGKEEVLPWPYESYRQLYLDWHIIQKAAGIPDGQHYVPQNCRSSCASGLIAAGVPTVVVKDFLGHGTVTTTEKFYINTKPALRAAAQARKVLLPDSCRTPVELDGQEKKKDSWQFATSPYLSIVPKVGLEPTLTCVNRILSCYCLICNFAQKHWKYNPNKHFRLSYHSRWDRLICVHFR